MKLYLDFSGLRRAWQDLFKVYGRNSLVFLLIGIVFKVLAIMFAILDIIGIEFKTNLEEKS